MIVADFRDKRNDHKRERITNGCAPFFASLRMLSYMKNALSKLQIALLYASFLRTDYLAILQCLDDINT